LGDTRKGKTFANAKLLEAAIATGAVAVVFSLDDKSQAAAQYAGALRANPADLMARPLAADESAEHIIFRGHTLGTNQSCSAEDLAAFVWNQFRTANPGVPVVANVDELRRATTPAGREWKSPTVPILFSEGGGVLVSVNWTAQAPQRIPLEAFDQSSSLGFFQMGGRAPRYLVDQDVLTDEQAELLPRLQRGQFILRVKGYDWDRRIYQF
jgi:hypothetical protein